MLGCLEGLICSAGKKEGEGKGKTTQVSAALKDTPNLQTLELKTGSGPTALEKAHQALSKLQFSDFSDDY